MTTLPGDLPPHRQGSHPNIHSRWHAVTFGGAPFQPIARLCLSASPRPPTARAPG